MLSRVCVPWAPGRRVCFPGAPLQTRRRGSRGAHALRTRHRHPGAGGASGWGLGRDPQLAGVLAGAVEAGRRAALCTALSGCRSEDWAPAPGRLHDWLSTGLGPSWGTNGMRGGPGTPLHPWLPPEPETQSWWHDMAALRAHVPKRRVRKLLSRLPGALISPLEINGRLSSASPPDRLLEGP